MYDGLSCGCALCLKLCPLLVSGAVVGEWRCSFCGSYFKKCDSDFCDVFSKCTELIAAVECSLEDGENEFNPLNAELNPICYLLALSAHHFLHVSRIRVKSLTLRLLMSYIYGALILDVSRSHTTTQHSR